MFGLQKQEERMKSIIDLIFDGEIDERNRVTKPKDSSKDKAYIAYEKLKNTLSEEQQKMLEKFIEETAVNDEKIYKGIYSRGFKVGLLIGIEAARFNPED